MQGKRGAFRMSLNKEALEELLQEGQQLRAEQILQRLKMDYTSQNLAILNSVVKYSYLIKKTYIQQASGIQTVYFFSKD
jgi:hypothetical protein